MARHVGVGAVDVTHLAAAAPPLPAQVPAATRWGGELGTGTLLQGSRVPWPCVFIHSVTDRVTVGLRVSVLV